MSALATSPLTAEAEEPMSGEVPDGWCENYALVAHDPERGVHMIYCTGSQPGDLALWHEYLLLALPDGSSVAWRSAGRGGDKHGPGGAITRWRCTTPGARWQFAAHGFGRRVARASLDVGPLADGPWSPVHAVLEFTAIGPAWVLSGEDLTRAGETSPFHYEQSGRVSGVVSVGAVDFHINGTGHRDHSRGPRDYASVLDHAWIDGQFVDGSYFAAYRMRLADGSEGVAAGCFGDAAGVRPAKVIAAPLLADDPADRYELVLEVERQRHTIAATITAPLGTTSYMTPNGIAAGRCEAPEVTQIVRDAGTRFTWNGVEGFGHTQRSLPGPYRAG